MGEFLSYYLTKSGCRVPILSQISINGSVEYLGIPDFHRTGGKFWAANLLAPRSCCVDGGTSTNYNLVIKSGVPYGSVSDPWRGAVPTCPAYVFRSPENARATARRIRDDNL